MASTMDDCVLDFDIDMFQQLPKYDMEKLHKSIVVTKTKLTSTNSLLKKYYNKGVICKSLENYLLATKESYKQVCIERIELREKCAALEEEVKKMHEANKELEEKYIAADNRYDGIQSHSKQLELLIKENETTIQSLKIENQLEKSTSKDFEKKYGALKKENEYLLRNICRLRDIVFGKKKATKAVKSFLNKYGKSSAGNADKGENSSDDIDAFDECLSPLEIYNDVLASPADNTEKTALKQQSNNINEENINNEDDSESSNEVVSTDTGRGSSLAFSDSDKCSLLSPEYYIDHSPLSAEVISNKHKGLVSVPPSPISTREFTNVATSPIIFKDFCDHMDTENPELSNAESLKDKKKSNGCGSPIIMIDRVVSPMFATQYVDISTSPDRNVNVDVGTSPLKQNNRTLECNYASHHNIQEKQCLDINHIVDDSSSDGEIQMIFDKMRFNQKLITPIPTTPAKPRSEVSTNIATQTLLHTGGVCPDAAKIKEENLSLQVTVAKLAQEVLNINNILNKFCPSIINKISINDEAQKLLQDKYLLEENDGMNLGRQEEPKTTPIPTPSVQHKEMFMETLGAKKSLSFKGKITKLRELFDDSPVPSQTDCLSPRPLMTALSRSPSPVPASPPPSPPPHSPRHSPRHSPPHSPRHSLPHSPPHSPRHLPRHSPPHSPRHSLPHSPLHSLPHSPLHSLPHSPRHSQRHSPPRSPPSPPPRSPPSPPADADSNILNNNDIDGFTGLKSKERLYFEEPMSNEESLSDQEIYEHEIVVELTPDSQESDRHSLHEILKEQQLERQSKPEERPIKKSPKSRKMTQLEKLRKNMVPKSKIKGAKLQEGRARGKLRIQPKRLTVNRHRVLGSACIDDKSAYEKACKVMAELKSKEKLSNTASFTTPEKSTQNEVDIHKNEQSVIRDSYGIPEKMSPKLCTVETGVGQNCAEQDKQQKGFLKTSSKPTDTLKCAFAGKDLSSPGIRKSLRTRSISKCTSDIEEKATHFNTNHLKSPALKRYGRNRLTNKNEADAVNNNNTITQGFIQHDKSMLTEEENKSSEGLQSDARKRLKRPSVDQPDIVPKRILRSSSIQQAEDSSDPTSAHGLTVQKIQDQTEVDKETVSYDDLDIFCDIEVEEPTRPDQRTPNINRKSKKHPDNPKHGILCTFIDKYGSKKMKRNPYISENATNAISKLLEDSIMEIQKLPPKDTKHAMDTLVKDLQTCSPNNLLSGLIKFLKEPTRKIESYNKINDPPAPPMTKVEQILIYVVAQLKLFWPSYAIVDNILNYIEYTLFMLNRTPEFDVIESLSHFYAVLCRYNKNRNRLRLFIIDAMYCLQYKAVPVIKQCLDVWMHILPLAHLGLAKNPLVICLVYLLHFYKCEDRFNRVQEIRNILHRKYFYEVSEWNEPGILEMIRNYILELRDVAVEKKMLRMCLIILAKRNGARWCQKHIIKNMLLPIIEQAEVPDRIKQFCVALLGPLLKPYPMDMKVNCEIIMNQLFDMLERHPTPLMEEAIYTSLVYMSRHNQYRVIKALLCWKPESVSSGFEDLLKNYVKERPVKSWKQVVSKIFIHN